MVYSIISGSTLLNGVFRFKRKPQGTKVSLLPVGVQHGTNNTQTTRNEWRENKVYGEIIKIPMYFE